MRLVYYLILLPLARLPRWARYLLSDFLALCLRKLIQYRVKQVEKNLELAFPELSSSQLNKTIQETYRNVADITVEGIRAFRMKKEDALSGLEIENVDVLQKLFDEGRDVILTGGHYANWESICWGGDRLPHEVYALYKPLRNEFMDNRVQQSRSRFGIKMVSIKAFEPLMSEPHKKPRMFIFGIDQRPRKSAEDFISFLGRKTAVFRGTERMAKTYNTAVVAGRLVRASRGNYKVSFELLFDQPRSTEEMEITKCTMGDVEELVRANPADWLWTHDRWKHTPYEKM